jgi:hypothetical protein
MLFTVLQLRTLILLAVPLLALEVATAAVAARQGWFVQKVRGWWWLITRARRVGHRRAEVQRVRRRSDRVLVPVLTGTVAPGPEAALPAAPLLSALAGGYWRAIRPLLR